MDRSKRFRVFCFAHAGGSATAYLSWQKLLGDNIDVCPIQLPGRGSRINEAAVTSMSALVPTLAELVRYNCETPFAFFGHSLGALVAFEVCRLCTAQGQAMPRHLFVSGCDAPRYRRSNALVHDLPDEELIQVLRQFKGTPPQVLEHHELMTLLLPAIRGDFALSTSYQYKAAAPLDVVISVLAGRTDQIPGSKEVHGWSEETINRCGIAWFDGGHFFIESRQAMVVNYLLMTLSKRDLI